MRRGFKYFFLALTCGTFPALGFRLLQAAGERLRASRPRGRHFGLEDWFQFPSFGRRPYAIPFDQTIWTDGMGLRWLVRKPKDDAG